MWGLMRQLDELRKELRDAEAEMRADQLIINEQAKTIQTLRKENEELKARLVEIAELNNPNLEQIMQLSVENKRLRTAIETAVEACTCRAIEPCEGCESLREAIAELTEKK